MGSHCPPPPFRVLIGSNSDVMNRFQPYALIVCTGCASVRCADCVPFNCFECSQSQYFPHITWNTRSYCLGCVHRMIAQREFTSSSRKSKRLKTQHSNYLRSQIEMIASIKDCTRCFTKMQVQSPTHTERATELLVWIERLATGHSRFDKIQTLTEKLRKTITCELRRCERCRQVQEGPWFELEDSSYCVSCCIQLACSKTTDKKIRNQCVHHLRQSGFGTQPFLCGKCKTHTVLFCNCLCHGCYQQAGSGCICS